MWDKIKKWFRGVEPGVYVVHTEKLRDPQPDDEDSLRSLQHHPGFVTLMNRFKLQQGILEAMLKTRHHKDIRDVDSIQAGLQWLGFAQAEVDRAVKKKAEAHAVRSKPYEQVEFERVFAQIQSV